MKEKISRKGFLKTGATAFGALLIKPSDLLAADHKEAGIWDNRSSQSYSNIKTKTRRGSWVQTGSVGEGDVDLSECEIVIGSDEHTAVRQAGKFLAADIEKISGYSPPVVKSASTGKTSIRLITIGNAVLPASIDSEKLKNTWESYQVLTDAKTVWLIGADFRGTAFAAYTLSERLGIDPLYIWTNFRPAQYSPLVLKKTAFSANSPTIKYRGFFHDDEDILPRPFDNNDVPLQTGDVPLEWYKRYFETALRLRMNMTAPYTRVHRRYEVQQCASDWGLFYTSHHYDILLSNPFGFKRFNLAQERGVSPQWDWFKNKQNMITYWKDGVLENQKLDAIWPVGLRGTDDVSYRFPAGTSEQEQTAVFNEAINVQVDTVKKLRPDKDPLFHFTLYTEMLDKYEQNRDQFKLPKEVMVIWPDDNNGIMRALPKDLGNWKHGVYYHLAYLGARSITKQITHITSPKTVADQFRNIIDAGATEFALINVSEFREYLMEARMIAEIAWDEASVLKVSDPATNYISWWSNEYFGAAALSDTVKAYQKYYELFNSPVTLWQGADTVQELIGMLYKKFSGQDYESPGQDKINSLIQHNKDYESFSRIMDKASGKMDPQQQQYFFEQLKLGMLVDWRPTQAALKLLDALNAKDKEKTMSLVAAAMELLEQFEAEILKAERPPFEKWYRETWIRSRSSPYNIHRSFNQVRDFYYSGGIKRD